MIFIIFTIIGLASQPAQFQPKAGIHSHHLEFLKTARKVV